MVCFDYSAAGTYTEPITSRTNKSVSQPKFLVLYGAFIIKVSVNMLPASCRYLTHQCSGFCRRKQQVLLRSFGVFRIGLLHTYKGHIHFPRALCSIYSGQHSINGCLSTFLGLLPWIFLTGSGFGKSGFFPGVSHIFKLGTEYHSLSVPNMDWRKHYQLIVMR